MAKTVVVAGDLLIQENIFVDDAMAACRAGANCSLDVQEEHGGRGGSPTISRWHWSSRRMLTGPYPPRCQQRQPPAPWRCGRRVHPCRVRSSSLRIASGGSTGT